jgi:hypothetical protein
MDDLRLEKIVGLLEELRDGQKLQLEHQAEALARQAEAAARQQDRIAKLDVGGALDVQQYASKVQSSARLIKRAQFVMFFYVPLSLAVLVFVCWLAFHRSAP